MGALGRLGDWARARAAMSPTQPCCAAQRGLTRGQPLLACSLDRVGAGLGPWPPALLAASHAGEAGRCWGQPDVAGRGMRAAGRFVVVGLTKNTGGLDANWGSGSDATSGKNRQRRFVQLEARRGKSAAQNFLTNLGWTPGRQARQENSSRGWADETVPV